MNYCRVRGKFIHISDMNRQHIYRFQKWTLANVAISCLLYYTGIGFMLGGTPVPYENLYEKTLAFVAYQGLFFFICGLFLQGVKHVFLLFDFCKKQHLVNVSFPKPLPTAFAWLLPGCLAFLALSPYPGMDISKQFLFISLAILCGFIRARTVSCRHIAIEQFRKEYPLSYFENLNDTESVFRGGERHQADHDRGVPTTKLEMVYGVLRVI
jgi:hypothetical protein